MICSASNLTLNYLLLCERGLVFIGGYAYETVRHTEMKGEFSLHEVPNLIQLLHTKPFEPRSGGQARSRGPLFLDVDVGTIRNTRYIGNPAIGFGGAVEHLPNGNEMPLGFYLFSWVWLLRGAGGSANQDKAYKYCPDLGIILPGC